MNNLTNVQLDNFLSDYEQSVQIEFLEVGKEKDELIESAKKRGILVENSRDLGVLKTIYAFTDKSNANGAILPSKEFRKVFPQIIGKPMNIDHDRRLVVGFYVDYRYIVKENKAISYAVFFKSNFPEIWDKARKLQKSKKLSSSFEIWSPESKRVQKENGEYELHNMEIAGGALIFEENGTEPAFKDAKVLNMAKEELQELVDDKCLVYASKYNEKELIYHKKLETASVQCECLKCGYKTEIDGYCNESKCPKCGGEMRRIDRPGSGRPNQSPNAKVQCSNCNEQIDVATVPEYRQGTLKCPKCFAILNGQSGQMIHPPQIIDFSMRCPKCKVGNWLLLSSKDNKSQIKCMSCAKEYDVEFDTKKDNELLDRINFMYTGVAHCYQCGNNIYVSGVSGVGKRMLNCKKCGLEFEYELSGDNVSRKIKKITEIEIIKSSEEEETKMDKKVDKVSEQKVEEQKVEEKEAQVEDKTQEAKTEEVEKSQDDKVKEEVTEKAEEQPEAQAEETENKEEVTEEKTEEAPKAEEQESQEELENSDIEEAAKWTRKFINDLPNGSFAVIEPNYLNGKTDNKNARHLPFKNANGKVDLPHLRNALARMNQIKPVTDSISAEELQAKAKKVLEKYRGKLKTAEMDKKYPKSKVIRKALKKTKDLKKSMEQASIDREMLLKDGIKKLVKQIGDLKKQVKLYESKAQDIVNRRNELGIEVAKKLSDEEILNDDKFARAKAEKENELLKAKLDTDTDIVGAKVKNKDDNWYANRRKAVDEAAFGKKDN